MSPSPLGLYNAMGLVKNTLWVGCWHPHICPVCRGILMDQTIMIERIPFQGFNRKLENWASFRRVFREMVKVSR